MRVLALLSILPLAAQPVPEAGWQVRGGLMTLWVPAYVGSDQHRLVAFPAFQADYGGRFTLGTSRVALGVGADWHLWRQGPWTLDVGMALEERRPEDRADALAGMGNRAPGLRAGAGMAWKVRGFSASAALSAGLRERSGLRLALTAGREFRLGPQWAGGVNLGLQFSDGDHARYEYGIEPAQALRREALLASGDRRLRPGDARVFTPGPGLRELRAGASLIRFLPQGWTATGLLFAAQVQGDAVDSPLVRQRLNAGCGFSAAKRF